MVQYTTTASRWGAYVGAIPHWLYFTPLRKHGPQWSQVVIWSSGIGTVAAILGIVIGVWMYSPSKRYRYAGAPTSIPYRGQKRLHTIFGLIFGLGAATWAFSGMLSMDPFPTREPAGRPVAEAAAVVAPAFRRRFAAVAVSRRRLRPSIRAKRWRSSPAVNVKELELTSFAGEPVYLATLARGDTRIIPLEGEPQTEFDRQRIIDVVTKAAEASGGARDQPARAVRPVLPGSAPRASAAGRSSRS